VEEIMYRTACLQQFKAQHYLIGGDWGKENNLHTHNYSVELCVEGPELNADGYLIDLFDLKKSAEKLLAPFENRTLNDLPEFAGVNPSIERLAAYICDNIEVNPGETVLSAIIVKVWEDDQAWASCRRDLVQVP